MKSRRIVKNKLPITVSQLDNKTEYCKQWRKLNPDHWVKRYGLTLERYDEMLKSQDYSCAICGTKEPDGKNNKFQIDHNHSTKQVRDLLCDRCNKGIGLFKENCEFLEKAANYIRKHSSTN